MNVFAVLLVSTTCLSQVFASYWLEGGGGGGGGHNLVGVPDLDHYGKLEYPKYELQDLGSETHGEIPPKTVKILKTISYKVPQPYPVHIPYKVPYPVHIEKPIPVVQTKIVKISHPIPIPVDKAHSPEEFHPQLSSGGGSDWSGSGAEGTFGGSFSESAGGAQQLQETYGVPGHEPGIPLGAGDYGSFGGGEDHGAEDRSGSYESVAQPQVEQGGEQIEQEQHIQQEQH